MDSVREQLTTALRAAMKARMASEGRYVSEPRSMT